jgi:hypothetical protein
MNAPARPIHRVETETMPESPELPGDLLAQGKTIMKAGTPFVTAISVQKPRNLDLIVKAIDREAEYAGDSFYYAWKDKKGNRIEGPSIGLANSLAREWTNCGVTVDFQETAEVFIITPRFIDIEKGFQCERVFRQRKNVVQGNFDPDRKLDMALQIGQSKAIRNVVVNAVPRWLVERGIQKAKEAVIKNIDPTKLDEYKAQVVSYFKTKGVTAEQLVYKAGKPMAEWTTRDIADFKGDKTALENGEATISELFPKPEGEEAPKGPVSLSDLPPIGGGAPATETPAPAIDTASGSGGPSAAEQAEIKRREEWESKALKCMKCPPLTFATDVKAEMDAHEKQKHSTAAPVPPPPKKGGDKPGSLFG